MSSIILDKPEDKVRNSNKGTKGNAMLPMRDDTETKPKKTFVRQSTKRSSQTKTGANTKLKADSTSELSDIKIKYRNGTIRNSSQPVAASYSPEVSPFMSDMNSNILKRFDFQGNLILKNGKKHKICFADQTKKGVLEEIVNIAKINNDTILLSSKQMPAIKVSSEVSPGLSYPPNARKVGNCSCACFIF